MRIRTAVLTGLTGLMLNVGLGDAFAQPVYRYYREAPSGRYYREAPSGRYAMNDRGQAAQVVRQAYLDVLRREPDRSGLRQYTDAMLRQGWSAADVRRSLANSDEYAQRFGRGGRGYYERGLRYRVH
jgi:hypothetical protein